ncbi:hypothetical protein [Frigoriflavimonas asaccharolytica]|uniref:Lipoprotein n=1 Tax=Frigoriflavimonas asaccharolytica TaxID=2735899 RepID=A0A8J8GBQ4_9FLAO|nr:hypothetical protein [Frigoriflavimonas asaccharolytica]NRS93269.1 hypothetical protein [Frigoriflavimonas asaccharolytica]
MKNKILFLLLCLFIGCKQNAQKYNYELADSNESYIMDNWDDAQKEDYYNKVGNIVTEFLLRENYTSPTELTFNKVVKDKLGIIVNPEKGYQKIRYHSFESDSVEGYTPQLIIFPSKRLISFSFELPLLNKSSLNYYNSNDFKNLDHSKEYNIVINKLLFNPNEEEIYEWLTDKQLDDLFIYLVCSFHFDKNEKILQHVIIKLKSNTENYDDQYLQLLFQRNKKIIDKNFISKVANIDSDRKLYNSFKNALISKFNDEEQKTFLREIAEIYEGNKKHSQNDNISFYVKNGFQIIDEISVDLDGDLDDDKIYITSSETEIVNAQIIILKNNNNSFSLWARNDSTPIMGQKEYKKTVTKGVYFTLEYNRDIEDKYNQDNFLTFKLEDNVFILHKFSQDIYDVKSDIKLPTKKWTNKFFGHIELENVSYDFIENLK